MWNRRLASSQPNGDSRAVNTTEIQIQNLKMLCTSLVPFQGFTYGLDKNPFLSLLSHLLSLFGFLRWRKKKKKPNLHTLLTVDKDLFFVFVFLEAEACYIGQTSLELSLSLFKEYF
jgi:hypothetical protein